MVTLVTAETDGDALPRPSTPPSPGQQHDRERRRLRLRLRLAAPLALLTVIAVSSATVLGQALTAPGNDSAAAKLAEWGRDHGLSAVITSLESWRYNHDQPAAGGLPSGGIPPPDGQSPNPPRTRVPLEHRRGSATGPAPGRHPIAR